VMKVGLLIPILSLSSSFCSWLAALDSAVEVSMLLFGSLPVLVLVINTPRKKLLCHFCLVQYQRLHAE